MARTISDRAEIIRWLKENADKEASFEFQVRTPFGPTRRTWNVPRQGYQVFWRLTGNPSIFDVRLILEDDAPAGDSS
jgi:hypothetical protein